MNRLASKKFNLEAGTGVSRAAGSVCLGISQLKRTAHKQNNLTRFDLAGVLFGAVGRLAFLGPHWEASMRYNA